MILRDSKIMHRYELVNDTIRVIPIVASDEYRNDNVRDIA